MKNGLKPVYTTLNSWHGTDKTGTRTIFIRAWTTYLGSPSTCKSGTAGTFIRAVPNFKCSVNGALKSLLLEAVIEKRKCNIHHPLR